jgi:hypothetical protein
VKRRPEWVEGNTCFGPETVNFPPLSAYFQLWVILDTKTGALRQHHKWDRGVLTPVAEAS